MGGYFLYGLPPMEDGYVIINVDGTIIDKIPVFSDVEETVYHDFIFGEHEHVGTLEIIGNRVRMLPMPTDICPEGICSDTGFISGMFQNIVCMPNKIHVYLDIDGI
ncbi:NusG domain II-containing protein [Alkalicella caledoniensis]|uniref:NusG domain II-containing protein n=2 Tax=Alkalicella caledoniensis TaxID=2731377 RepID=A0A7G9WBK1_ALKCA|nr:NusG domain II-containing protein [Alkalicella caledoniensis]